LWSFSEWAILPEMRHRLGCSGGKRICSGACRQRRGGVVTGIIFLVIAPYNRNPRIKFHAFQSILFSLVWTLGWVAMIPLHMLLPFGLSLLLSLFSLLLWGGGLLLWLVLMWKAYQGHALSLPVIGGVARQQAGK
jgi:uncharacterized membrane protein